MAQSPMATLASGQRQQPAAAAAAAVAKPLQSKRQCEGTADSGANAGCISSGGGACANTPATGSTDNEVFTEEEIAECRMLFDVFDANCDGFIDRAEFGQMMKTLGLQLNERELDKLFGRADGGLSEGGGCDVEGLLALLRQLARPISVEEELTEAFRFFSPGEDEKDSSDTITQASLARVLKDMGEDFTEAECGASLAALTNGVGTVDFTAFQRLCYQQEL
mmetsp:Transcript_8437/g.15882  ORF Transcript_8437/g.15882 Transcript_8437/m.15882 type:complete len:222 (-) Transcript_8437:177-842(-)